MTLVATPQETTYPNYPHLTYHSPIAVSAISSSSSTFRSLISSNATSITLNTTAEPAPSTAARVPSLGIQIPVQEKNAWHQHDCAALPNAIQVVEPRLPQAPPYPPPVSQISVPADQKQHPRRTNRLLENPNNPGGTASEPCSLPPVPTLQRQTERKVNFVDNLVDSAAQIVETIWPPPTPHGSAALKDKVLPLRTFIQETLRRSRTSYSTLQVALYYLIMIRPYLPSRDCDFSSMPPEEAQMVRAKQCGRRMFLAALILASKYLQDRNYSARAWSKISGLNTQEININEMAFLDAINWRLHISETIFNKWTDLVLKYTSPPIPSTASPWSDEEKRKKEWCELILTLTPHKLETESMPTTGSLPGGDIGISISPPGNDTVFSATCNPTPIPSIVPAAVQTTKDLDMQQPLPKPQVHPSLRRTSSTQTSSTQTSSGHIAPAAGVSPRKDAYMAPAVTPTSKLSPMLAQRKHTCDFRRFVVNDAASGLPTPSKPSPDSILASAVNVSMSVNPVKKLGMKVGNKVTECASPKAREAALSLNMLKENSPCPSGCATPSGFSSGKKRTCPESSDQRVLGDQTDGITTATPIVKSLKGFASPVLNCRSPVLDSRKKMRYGRTTLEGMLLAQNVR